MLAKDRDRRQTDLSGARKIVESSKGSPIPKKSHFVDHITPDFRNILEKNTRHASLKRSRFLWEDKRY